MQPTTYVRFPFPVRHQLHLTDIGLHRCEATGFRVGVVGRVWERRCTGITPTLNGVWGIYLNIFLNFGVEIREFWHILSHSC